MLLASHSQLHHSTPGPQQLMATITMASISGEARSPSSRGHRKRMSGATPPPFSFPAMPLSTLDGPGPVEETDTPLQDPSSRESTLPTTPPLQITPTFESSSWATDKPAAFQQPFDPDSAPPDVTVISSTPPDNLSRSSPAALPSFSFGASSDSSQRPNTSDQLSTSRRHKHKRSTAQSIDISGLDLRPSSAVASKSEEVTGDASDASDASKTPATTPHKLTFGPSVQMESHATPPSSRGSSVRFSDPPPLPAIKRDHVSSEEDESALIDLDLAVLDNPPSPRARKGRRAGSMHSGGNRIIISQQPEGHRRTESAPQLAPAFLLDPNFTRRQSITPSTLFTLGDVFEEDEDQEPRHDAPDMTNSALPSPQTTLATPRLDTANSSALSFGATSTATTSDGDFSKRSASRRKRFGRKLMFWKRFSHSETSLVCDLRNH